MADISKITPPGSQTTYNLKDATAREQAAENKNNILTVQTSLEVGQNDDGKVLTATYSGGTGTYSWVTPSGGGGTSDYTALSNKPQIGGITLTGNKSLSDLGIAPASAVTLVSGLNTTGTIKNGSSETSATGYIASPIISGIPYYKDTTYESKSEASGGTAVSLCTTGEKYTWNNKSTLQLTNSTTPIVDGTAAIGTSTYAAKADHVHPTDTSRQAAITAQSPLSADFVSDTNTTHKFATQTQLDQISTNANNILTVYNANGRKNIIPNKQTLIKDDMTYTWTADGTIQISGTKTAGTGNYVEPLSLTELNKLGLSTGDTIVLSSNGSNSFISVIFWSSGSSYSSSYDITTGSREVLIPNNYTHMLIRVGVKAAETSASETISAMICNKKLWDISSDFAPYAPSNFELYQMILNL